MRNCEVKAQLYLCYNKIPCYLPFQKVPLTAMILFSPSFSSRTEGDCVFLFLFSGTSSEFLLPLKANETTCRNVTFCNKMVLERGSSKSEESLQPK